MLWEIKSPDAAKLHAKKGNELNFVGNAIKDAGRNFSNPYDPYTGKTKVDFDGKKRAILNLKYRPADVQRDRLMGKILGEMKSYHVNESIIIDESGSLDYLTL